MTSEETLVVVGIEIIARLVQFLESPAINLAIERFILALSEVLGHRLANEEILVVDLPCPSMWL